MTLQMILRTLCLGAVLCSGLSQAQDQVFDDKLGAGDTVRIQVFQNPDLTLETRIQESGDITFPLIGSVRLAGLTVPNAEKLIAAALKNGGYMQQPQINVSQVQSRRKQLAIMGAVLKPGLHPLEYIQTRLSDVLALAGGVAQGGADTVVVTGQRDGRPFRQEVDLLSIYLQGTVGNNLVMAPGDTVYVSRAPVYYIYGEAQRSGSFRVERNMTFLQALASAGGPTARGTEKGLRVHRHSLDGKVTELTPSLTDMVQPDDVIFVRESLF